MDENNHGTFGCGAQTALIAAAANGHIECVTILIANGVDINAVNEVSVCVCSQIACR